MKKRGFTLIELIIVITILAILGTIAFISFRGYSEQSRNSKITSDLSMLHTGLSLYKAEKGVVPMPDNAEIVTSGSTQITFEGKVGDNVRRIVRADNNITNPFGEDYEYATNGSQKLHVLVGELEEVAYSHTIAKAEDKTKFFKGDEILILYNSNNEFVTADIENLSSSNFTAYLGEKELTIADNGGKMQVQNVPEEIKKNAPTVTYSCEGNLVIGNATITNNSDLTAKTSYQNSDSSAPCYYQCKAGFSGNNCEIAPPKSCKAILDRGDSTGSKIYSIYPDGSTKTDVYCDMTTDGGGWTIIVSDGNIEYTDTLYNTTTTPTPSQKGLIKYFVDNKINDNFSEMRITTTSNSDTQGNSVYDIKQNWLGELVLGEAMQGYKYSAYHGFSGGRTSPLKCNYALIIKDSYWCTITDEADIPYDYPINGKTIGASKTSTNSSYGSLEYSWIFNGNGIGYRLGWIKPNDSIYKTQYYDKKKPSYLMIR